MNVIVTWNTERGCWALTSKSTGAVLGTAFQVMLRHSFVPVPGWFEGDLVAAIWEPSTTDHEVLHWALDEAANEALRLYANEHGARVEEVHAGSFPALYLTWEHAQLDLEPRPRVLGFDPERMGRSS